MSNLRRQERDESLRRVRSLSTGMVVTGVAAIGVISVGVAAAVPGRSVGQTSSSISSDGSTSAGSISSQDQSTGQAPQAVNQAPAVSQPVATSGGS